MNWFDAVDGLQADLKEALEKAWWKREQQIFRSLVIAFVIGMMAGGAIALAAFHP